MTSLRAGVRAFSLPLARPLAAAGRIVTERRGFILRLEIAGGAVGLGEASPAWWLGGDSLDDARASLEAIVGVVGAGASLEELETLAASGRLSPSAACALDCALLDAGARDRGRTVCEVLGGEGGGSEIERSAFLGGESEGEIAAAAAAARRDGFVSAKLKVGGRPVAADRRRIAAALGGLAGAVRLRLDANRAWSADEARRALDGLDPAAVATVEEPLRAADPAALAALRRTSALPIALDESVESPADLERFAAAGALDVVVLKAARLGGLRPALALARRARALGVGVAVTDSLEAAIGMSAALHLAASLPAPCGPIGLAGAALLFAGAVPAFLRATRMTPRGPGLGISAAAAGEGERDG